MVARVTAPGNEPNRYGLFSVADVRTDGTANTGTNDRWQFEGADWNTIWCSRANHWDLACKPTPPPETFDVTFTASAASGSETNAEVVAIVEPDRNIKVTAGDSPSVMISGSNEPTNVHTETLEQGEVSAEITSVPVDNGATYPDSVNINAKAVVNTGPGPRVVSVKVDGARWVDLNTGQPAKKVASHNLPRRAVTVTLSATTEGEVMAEATVDAGDPRDINITIPDNEGDLEATVTTGDPAKHIATLSAGRWPFTVEDAQTTVSGEGELNITTESGGDAEVTINPPAPDSLPVTTKDKKSGATWNGQLDIDIHGRGTTTGGPGYLVSASIRISAEDTVTGKSVDGVLAIANDRAGKAVLSLQLDGREPKATEPGDKYVSTGAPFAVYDSIDCTQLGLADPVAKAESRLRASERRAVEKHFWLTQLAPEAEDLTPAGTLPTIADAVAILEQGIADRYNGIGVIHSSRIVHPFAQGFVGRDATDDADLDTELPDVELLRTELWTKWAFGAGYTGTSPAGLVPDPGTTWIYATGAVLIRRSPVVVPATPGTGAFNPRTNRTVVYAERMYVVGHECFSIAVHVRLTDTPIPAGGSVR